MVQPLTSFATRVSSLRAETSRTAIGLELSNRESPEWDSNPQLFAYKANASAVGASGARAHRVLAERVGGRRRSLRSLHEFHLSELKRRLLRREWGSNPQGFYARRVSNPVPSPSFGLSLQRVQSFNRRIVVSATRAIAAPTVYAAMSDHVNVLPRMTSVRRFGSMPRRFTRSSAWPISTM